MPVNTAVRAVVRSPGKAAHLGVGVVLAGRGGHFFYQVQDIGESEGTT